MDQSRGHGVTRVAILAERRLFRDAIASGLTSDPEFIIVGDAANGDDLLDLCELRHPDIVLVSVAADIAGALVVLAALRDRFTRVRVVVVYENLSPVDLAAIWRAGVDKFVPSSHGLDALRLVLRRCTSGPDPGNGGRLTEQERAILALVGGGHTVCRIAELLGTTTHAVENHKRRIYRKLDVVSQSQAVARAATLGIINRSPRLAALPARAGTPLSILRGPVTRNRERAVVALLAAGMPFSIEGSAMPPAAQRWDWGHRGPVLLLLVDPAPSDWPGRDIARLPVVLVRDGPLRQPDAADAFSTGMVAVVTADRVVDDLVPALRLAAHGLPVPDVFGARRADADRELPELTARESDILLSIASGHTVRQTARSLGIAEKTVENTQSRLFRKLGARNRPGAVAAAHALGIIESVETEPPGARRLAHSGPAHSGPAHSGPAHSGPAHSGPAHSGPATAALHSAVR